MASHLLKESLAYLKHSRVFIQLPLSSLLYGLETLIELHFSCPCNVTINADLVNAMFIGPFLLILALMFFFYRPFKHGWFCCPKKANGETKDEILQCCPKSFASCLILPLMWVIMLFLDGNYFVCSKTYWNGYYVFDEKLNMSWCKPAKGTRNETELRGLTSYNLHYSRFIGYVLLGALSVVLIISVSVYDCCITGKCDSCPSCILRKCGRTDPELGSSSNETDNQRPVGSPMHAISMEVLSSDQSHEPRIPRDVPDPETGNRQGEGSTEPTGASTGETPTEPTETELFI